MRDLARRAETSPIASRYRVGAHGGSVRGLTAYFKSLEPETPPAKSRVRSPPKPSPPARPGPHLTHTWSADLRGICDAIANNRERATDRARALDIIADHLLV